MHGTMWRCYILVFSLIIFIVSQCQMNDNALDNQLALKNGCTCHGYNLTYECTVVGRPSEITIWRGSALSNCQNNELSLLHRQFKTASTSCDNPSIVAMGRDTDNGSYTSQLTIMVTDDVIGKSVECAHYDNNITTTIGSLNITVTDVLQLPTHYYNTSVAANCDSKRTMITFNWGTRNIPDRDCPGLQYNIRALNCGNCPATTTHTNVTCSNVPTDGSICKFTAQIVLCGNFTGETLEREIINHIDIRDSGYVAAVFFACLFAFLMVVSVVISIFGVLLYENRMKNLTAAVEMTRKCKSLDTGQSSSVDINADKNIAYGHVEY